MSSQLAHIAAAISAYIRTAVRESAPSMSSCRASDRTPVGKANAAVVHRSSRFAACNPRSTLRIRANAWWWLSQMTAT